MMTAIKKLDAVYPETSCPRANTHDQQLLDECEWTELVNRKDMINLKIR